ncbi:HEPN domain-containing protein [Methylosinus sp. H3A]|uniref:HEPN domain-containing protein n=1 Tax=Methylosinus sp. H3A TaxID=2785786 RepID=UPI001FEE0528|nr:HEPN domain-containing protein [Methylosinus sp. H3A]
MHGLNVQRPISLSNQIRLFPLAAAPDSPNIRALSRNSFELVDIAWIMPPTIAVYDLGTVQGSIDPDYRLGLETAANFALLDAARAFTLTNDGAAVVGISWTDFVDPELMRAEIGRMWMPSQFDGALKDGLPLNVDEEALAWAERYLDMDESFRRSLDVAIDRLNLARRRRSPGDRAIDCGICLEALLGDDDPKELTHKLRVRAALLLGSTLEERRDIRREVGKLYDLRSKVVHGIARKPEQILTDEQCASRGLEICKQAVRAIVIRNARPDFKTWELTGGRDSDIG